MSVVTIKSTLITNRDATPKALTDSFISAGQLSQSYGWVFTGAADSAGSAYPMVQVPSSARVSALSLINTTLGNSSVIDVGIWYPTTIPTGGGAFLSSALAGTLISSSSFRPAMLGDTANTVPLELQLNTTARMGANYQEMPLWQMIGLASDPEISLDIGISVRVAVATAGYVGMKATYIY